MKFCKYSELYENYLFIFIFDTFKTDFFFIAIKLFLV